MSAERAAAYAAVGEAIAARIEAVRSGRAVVLVAGESGAGKTTLALAVNAALDGRGAVVHQDDYFRLPPRANDAHRRATGLASVGTGEVDLARLAQDARSFLAGATALEVPVTDRDHDRFLVGAVDLHGVDVLFIEGTYTCTLDLPAIRVFIDRDYRETRAGREARARDAFDDFTEPILEIEHKLIRPQLERAHLVVDGALELTERHWPPNSLSP